MEQRHQDQVGRKQGRHDGGEIGRIQTDIAFEKEAGVVAQDIAGAIQAPGNHKARNHEEDVYAEVAILP